MQQQQPASTAPQQPWNAQQPGASVVAQAGYGAIQQQQQQQQLAYGTQQQYQAQDSYASYGSSAYTATSAPLPTPSISYEQQQQQYPTQVTDAFPLCKDTYLDKLDDLCCEALALCAWRHL